MPDYKSLYFSLASRVASVTEALINIQLELEEQYIADEERELSIVTDSKKKEEQ